MTPEQLIDCTIGLEGREHDAPLDMWPALDFQKVCKFSSGWGRLNSGQYRNIEWRGAVFAQFQRPPRTQFRIYIRNGEYWSWQPSSGWMKEFDVVLNPVGNGGYMGKPGNYGSDPYQQSRGRIAWRREPSGSYSAPWNTGAQFPHFWAGKRHPIRPNQQAELAYCEMRIGQEDGQFLDLSQVKVLGGIGIDYYRANENNSRAPGPGIARAKWLTGEWQPYGWLTLPSGTVNPLAPHPQLVAGFSQWIAANRVPHVDDTPNPPPPPPPPPPPTATARPSPEGSGTRKSGDQAAARFDVPIGRGGCPNRAARENQR